MASWIYRAKKIKTNCVSDCQDAQRTLWRVRCSTGRRCLSPPTSPPRRCPGLTASSPGPRRRSRRTSSAVDIIETTRQSSAPQTSTRHHHHQSPGARVSRLWMTQCLKTMTTITLMSRKKVGRKDRAMMIIMGTMEITGTMGTTETSEVNNYSLVYD